jgi:type VI secretion system protein ImpJ
MSLFAKVAWKDGMFLLPQHFQQAERSLEAALRTQVLGPAPLGWGVLELALNTTAIAEGRLEIERCRAILPDGTAVDIPGTDLPPPAVTLRAGPAEQAIAVYLTLPAKRARTPLVTSTSERVEVRFVERSLTVPDDLDPEQHQTIDIATKNLRLGLGSAALEGVVALQLAEVTRGADGAWTLRSDYVAPTPLLTAAPGLQHKVQQLLARVRAKVDELAAKRRQAGEALAFDAATLTQFWLLHALQQQLPVVRHQLGCSATHPAQLYAELLRLAGGLLVFSPDASPDFPVYQHDAIGACYAALLLRIQELLGIVVRERYTVIRLTQNRSVWDGRIDDAALLERGEFYLVATGDVPRQEFERLPGACKVAESGRVESLARTANPGLRLESVPRPREPIPVRKDAQYFRLFSEGPLWEEVRKSGQIGLFVPRAPEGLTLELVALRDAHGGAGR